MDRGTWRATVLEVTKSQTRLSNEAHTYLNVDDKKSETWPGKGDIWAGDRGEMVSPGVDMTSQPRESSPAVGKADLALDEGSELRLGVFRCENFSAVIHLV